MKDAAELRLAINPNLVRRPVVLIKRLLSWGSRPDGTGLQHIDVWFDTDDGRILALRFSPELALELRNFLGRALSSEYTCTDCGGDTGESVIHNCPARVRAPGESPYRKAP